MPFIRCFFALAGVLSVCPAIVFSESPPNPAREMRAAWIATVANIDWPSKPGLSVEQQQAEFIALLETAVELRLNAVVLQVRPACDAIYPSELEPWSEYLSGVQGAPPSGDSAQSYDPLAWAIAESHQRGLELHAWMNPYRAGHASRQGELAEGHLANTKPELVREYGKQLWLDPGEPGAMAHSLAVVLDVVRRYDVDGVHFDDYFYPYPVNEKGEDGAERQVPFPDDASWEKYLAATPTADRLTRDDWRRDNVNRFIQAVSEETHRLKPHVRFGVSPFGIWRPGHPESIQGFDAYQELYADARLWLHEGWVDYFTPQLYWPIDQQAQSFPTLLRWWKGQNLKERGLWPGLFTSKTKVGNPPWDPSEIVNQIGVSRELIDAPGQFHFSMKALAQNYSGVADALREGPYAEPAIVPAAPWLAGETPTPGKPKLSSDGSSVWSASLEGDAVPRWWLVWELREGEWRFRRTPGEDPAVLTLDGNLPPQKLAVSAVDHFGRQGEVSVVHLD